MIQRVFGVIGIGLVVAAAGCGSNPAAPATSGGSTGSGASSATSTASIGAPRPLAPANGTQIKNVDQPITLFAANAVVTSTSGTTYTFEIASDAGFNSKFQTKDAVAEGANGQTSVKLDSLPASSDYYWHVRATGGGTSGIFGPVFKFTIGPAITISAPQPIAPLTGGAVQTTLRPTLRVANAVRLGTNNPITYKFEIANSSAFTTLLASGTVNEGVGETDFIPNVDLPANANVFWHATAIDAGDGISSVASAVQLFSVNPPPSQASVVAGKLGITLWPGIQPPGTNGHAVMGSDWNVEPITSFNGVTFMNPPVDELQIFDLMDRGMSPGDAVDWMHGHGYATDAVYYSDVAGGVIGFPFEYLTFLGGRWDIVIRIGG
jgi:hypothetical protein